MHTARVQFRPFTSADWLGLQGAEPLGMEPYIEPLIGDITVDGTPATAIVHGGGCCVIITHEDGTCEEWDATGLVALRAVAVLGARTSRKELDELGMNYGRC